MAVTITDVAAAHARLEFLIKDLTDEQARGDSALPGWTRGHVLTHIANVGRALTRQALHGADFDMYDGGRPGRDAAIEAGAGRSAAELRDDVLQSSAELEKAWAEMGPDDWARPVRYRDATAAITVPTRWREVEIHAADLRLGYGSADWTPDFCIHLFDFLSPRVPAGTKLTLVTTHGQWSLGEGEPVEVSGDITDIAAWLAGRDHGPLTARTQLPGTRALALSGRQDDLQALSSQGDLRRAESRIITQDQLVIAKIRILLTAAALALLGAAPAQATTSAQIDTGGGSADLRFGPGTQYSVTGSAADGQAVTIVCTTSSEPVTGRHGTSTIWDKLSDGSWVADAFVYTGTSGRVEPECGPTGARPTADDYPYRDNPNVVDRWVMYSGQCTSWVAWRMEQLNGYFHNSMWRNGISGRFGNAHQWNDNAVRLGYTVDRTPRVGAIAQWEPNAGGASGLGHVAYISAVNGTTVTVQEYNWETPLGFDTRDVPLNQISNIIHFAAGT